MRRTTEMLQSGCGAGGERVGGDDGGGVSLLI